MDVSDGTWTVMIGDLNDPKDEVKELSMGGDRYLQILSKIITCIFPDSTRAKTGI